MSELDLLLTFDGVEYAYGDGRTAARGVSVGVERGSITAILGPNGAGKTTLLHLTLGWLRPRAGRVSVDGRQLPEWPRRDLARALALVPQTERTPFPLSVLDFVMLGRAPYLAPLAMPGPADAEAAAAAIADVGLTDLATKPVTALSGGERQLALLARGFAQRPRLLLMDEPSAHLDLAHKSRLVAALRARQAAGLTVLLTTHEPDFAAAVATDLVLMRDGQVQCAGSVERVFQSSELSAVYGVPVRTGTVDGRRVAAWT